MRVLSGPTWCRLVAGVAFVLAATVHGTVFAGEGVPHSPFGVLNREGFVAVARPETAEHEALFARPEETTDVPAAAAPPSTPADDVVFAEPAMPAGREIAADPVTTPLPPPLTAATFDAVVFGPPVGEADLGPMSDRFTGTPPTPESSSEAMSPSVLTADEAARLKARARELLANGSVAPARALLEGAASGGDAEGEYLLAQTYDPATLSRSGVIGIAGDAGKADALYRAAQLGGYPRPDENASAAQR